MSTPSRVSATGSTYYQNIDQELVGQRLDNFLLGQLKGVPRSHVYRLIRSGQVRVNSGRVRASYRLKVGDRVRVPPVSRRPASRPRIPEGGLQWLEDRILAEDSRLLVLDKPPGMAVHAGTGIDFGCIEALRSLRPGLRALDLVHRLDRDASGLLVFAKSEKAKRVLQAQFQDRTASRTYHAVVRGSYPRDEDVLKSYLVQNRALRMYVTADPRRGKLAITRVRVLRRARSATLLEVVLESGRKHQIRVHLAETGHPLLGDRRYAEDRAGPIGRLALHAVALEIEHPTTGKRMRFESRLPRRFLAPFP